ncbi:DUF2809 domain-containing protein [Herbiconiux sp. L3-i23]|uniref:ribosomal maturation YjgA family protein n=1 Tax=Herbiconiux sp. L3-i23 TaxID=2905871 RepID=UPI002073A3CB|nr:DUF2809 domain-containing protein [Herbiconiux sp. L3-i23]
MLLRSAGVAIGIVVPGLAARFLLPDPAGDLAGGVLYAVLVTLIVDFALRPVRPLVVAVIAFGCCALIEFTQLAGVASDLASVFPPAALVLGTGYSAVDLAAYAIGALTGAAVLPPLLGRNGRKGAITVSGPPLTFRIRLGVAIFFGAATAGLGGILFLRAAAAKDGYGAGCRMSGPAPRTLSPEAEVTGGFSWWPVGRSCLWTDTGQGTVLSLPESFVPTVVIYGLIILAVSGAAAAVFAAHRHRRAR